VRNDRLWDYWSAAHVAWSLAISILVGPWWGLALMVAWEPIEIFLLGPRLARWGISFGHETWRNSVSDMVFDAVGALLAFLLVLPLWDPMHVL
jgi:hypothetical protein